MIQFCPEDRFIWLKLIGNTMPPQHPNNDDNNEEEEDEEEEDDEEEPAVIREPDEGE
ncbi:MAG TPA: hypothetical protein VK687_15600 [Bryobacteraceae bacterium]|nr:hypothetical protein [Bryobacteraceae bacterium]